MSQSRRKFIKDIAVAGTVASVGSVVSLKAAEAETSSKQEMKDRCPYFDQPMYCKGQSRTGKPMCEE